MPILQDFMIGRRALVAAGGAATLAGGLGWSAVSLGTIPPKAHKGADPMTYITASDGAQIFYKDWGPRDAQPLVFHHGWPLTADEWDNQLLFFLSQGYRVIAHDRRGHGRSTQTDHGNEMGTYAADVAALVASLDLKGAVHIGHSTGGGEVAHYADRAKAGTIAKLSLFGAVTPGTVKKARHPSGIPVRVFGGVRKALGEERGPIHPGN